ncbi:DUF6957 family protein [Pseudomonas fluorescens]|uniref:DUF6957 domain-containing protein n=1 Tax=Pseudomonas fluorescens TaxID=294 RepID=A0A5E7FNB3_PSEFL|nr:hypothetical protein [Pseudomonas fluorescens]VVO40334.1 hypothetical protein PS833_05756 [Pseudomonas fluorescens]
MAALNEREGFLIVTLDEISQLFYGAGEEIPSWSGSQEDLISLAGRSFPGKPFCIVRQWILIDLIVTPEENEKLTKLGLLPATLFGRFEPTMWARSNFGKSFTEGCFFETKDTVYLLLGSGLRK